MNGLLNFNFSNLKAHLFKKYVLSLEGNFLRTVYLEEGGSF